MSTSSIVLRVMGAYYEYYWANQPVALISVGSRESRQFSNEEEGLDRLAVCKKVRLAAWGAGRDEDNGFCYKEIPFSLSLGRRQVYFPQRAFA